jgi:hypothetical protein
MQINKRLKRAVEYEGDTVRLFVFEEDPSILREVGIVPRKEAHQWFHGNEPRDVVPETDPTVDEMLAAIEARIKDDVKSIMDHALAHEDNLAYLYKCAKRGRLVRPCW